MSRGPGATHCPVAFVKIGETVEAACRREVHEEAGIEVSELILVGVYSDLKRDPRGHIVSVAYTTQLPSDSSPRAGSDATSAEWSVILVSVKRERNTRREVALDFKQDAGDFMSDDSGVQQAPKVTNAIRARGAVRGHNVRYVLAFSLIATILAFILIALYFGGVRG